LKAWGHRLVWLAVIWAAGVAVVAAVSLLLRLWLEAVH
jgi:hypothetical protein